MTHLENRKAKSSQQKIAQLSRPTLNTLCIVINDRTPIVAMVFRWKELQARGNNDKELEMTA